MVVCIIYLKKKIQKRICNIIFKKKSLVIYKLIWIRYKDKDIVNIYMKF